MDFAITMLPFERETLPIENETLIRVEYNKEETPKCEGKDPADKDAPPKSALTIWATLPNQGMGIACSVTYHYTIALSLSG